MPKNKPPATRNNQPKPVPQQQQTIQSSQQWSGPLPPPAALDQFNQIIPNGAERIMRMVEQEQAHRIEYESSALKATIRDTLRGHWIGAAISLAAIGGCIYSVYIHAHPAVSVALVSVPIASIIHAILKSKSTK
ncbi:DUF2335 domain-containing protein [Undibacterium arcticum]|uniref:DUF2335 domain-containing protein n=1 Tax=Undibacterium arcticum TaxID=1762892 RepID=A0ABV7F0R0_9BURK